MNHFNRKNGVLHCEEVPLTTIAEQVGTPCYIYSHATIERHFNVFKEALKTLPHLICFSAKANSNGAVLATLAQLGSGTDIVSGGELQRVLTAGIPAERVVFSGVGKTKPEIQAALAANILMFNVESNAELDAIEQVANSQGTSAPVAIRINPDVDAQSHPYISTGLRTNKFGIDMETARLLYRRAAASKHLKVVGIDCHIGSQLEQLDPIVAAVEQVADFCQELQQQGMQIDYFDVGGGLGIPYSNQISSSPDVPAPPTPAQYGAVIENTLRRTFGQRLPTLICEPGRLIMGNAGILLTKVILNKSNEQKKFVVVDAAMNDLLRPALYQATHEIQPVLPNKQIDPDQIQIGDVVGPVCESSDFLARDIQLPLVQTDDLLAVMSAGAYGFVMSSNYNSRPRPAEVLVKKTQWAVVRRRETLADIVANEVLPPWL